MIVGLDLAPARSGYTSSTGNCAAIAPQRSSKRHAQQRADIRMQLAPKLRLDRERNRARVAIIEGYLLYTRTPLATIRRAELHGVIEEVLWIEGYEPVYVNPSTLKAFAGLVIGRQPKSKDDMVSAALTLGYQPHGDDNEADSALLHALGVHWYRTALEDPFPSWPPLEQLSKGVRETLRALPWPDNPYIEIGAA